MPGLLGIWGGRPAANPLSAFSFSGIDYQETPSANSQKSRIKEDHPMTLSELRTKEVINMQDGRKLGRVMDIEFCVHDSRVTALVVPAETSLIQTLRGEKCGTVIPWEHICRIGDDVVLVSLSDLGHHQV